MTPLARVCVASLCAVAAQPVVFVARFVPELAQPEPIYGFGQVLLAVTLVAAVIVLLLGVPAFLLLRRFGREGWISLPVTGFAIAALLAALFWPRGLESLSSGRTWHGSHVEMYVNGVPTKYAWLAYFEGVVHTGLHGFFGALAFYACWRWLAEERSPSHAQQDRR